MTSFYAIKDSQYDQIQTIETLAAKGCSALVFQTGILDELSQQVIQRADVLGLPIIEVAEEVAYPEIIQPLVGAILREKTYLLQRSDEIHRRMINLYLAGGGLEAISSALSSLVDRPVMILDAWGSQIADSRIDDTTNLIEESHKKPFFRGEISSFQPGLPAGRKSLDYEIII